jgi:hypothetical protein
MQGLTQFVVAAKAACYVGGGERAPASRLGSKDLRFSQGDWSYLDSYFGGTDFLGQETVWFKDQPVWAMNYYGAVLEAAAIDGARGAEVIRAALSALYREGRFLGGWSYNHGPYLYTDESTGDVAMFTGVETIMREGKLVYRLHYHGGMIKP